MIFPRSVTDLDPMTTTCHSPFPPFPIDLSEDHYQPFFSPSKPVEAASSSSLPYPIFINPTQEGGYYRRELQPMQHQEEAKIYAWGGESVCDNKNDHGLQSSACKKGDSDENHSDHNSAVKWMSSKMRLMKKMMSSDQTVAKVPEASIQKFEDQKEISSPSQTTNSSNNSCNNSSATVRVCADCNTTKTPLWRGGPRGPKSLCNACGIRQRKARRAMAAAAAAAGPNGTIFGSDTRRPVKTKVQDKDKKTSSNNHLPFKKRGKFTAQTRGRKKLCVEDLTIILSKNSAYQRVFPQDEKDAAILLMALSYGLVHG